MLEKGNKTVGNLRRTIYWGGSDFAAERSIQVTKHKVTLDADGNESKHSMTMMRENAHGRAYQTMGLQLMQEHISAEKRARALNIKSENAKETERVKRESALASRQGVLDDFDAATIQPPEF